VFEGCGMEDETRTMDREDFLEERVICDAAEIEGCELRLAGVCEIALQFVKAVFRSFESDDVCTM